MGKALVLIACGGIIFYLFTTIVIDKKDIFRLEGDTKVAQQESQIATEQASSSQGGDVGTSTLTLSSLASTSSPTDEMVVKENSFLMISSSTAPSPRIVTHQKAPETVHAFYMTSWIAGTKDAKEKLIQRAVDAKMNAFVIDVKDNTGVVSWNGRVKEKDLEALIDDLHSKGFYLIARITAFQDPVFAQENPSEAIHRADDTLWKSKKGEAWVDPGSHKMWDYLLSLGQASYEKGFDEVNLDYIRFSTDGLHEKLVYPRSGAKGNDIKNGGRENVIDEFYTYITEAFQGKGIPVSGDVFGIITTSKEDTAVLGQNFASAIQHFDYIAPMVYPSHYAPGSFGYQNPASHPGPVITEALKGALLIVDTVASSTGQATSTLKGKIRPWYQDFNMGAVYTAELVKAQIEAGNKLGVTSFMMWDPNNRYTISAYK